MLSSIEILILALIQGVSEYLPVSSAAHLVLVSKYYVFTNQSLLIDICLHLGSLIAIIFYFRNDILNFIKNKDFLIKILIGTMPIIPVGYIMFQTGLMNQLRSLEVMLNQDPQSLIPVISSESRLHAILKGHGLERKGRLINVKKTATFKKGEELYSSGLGKVFPPNYLVGRVIHVEDKSDNEFLNIEVEFLKLPEEQEYFLVFTK